MKNTMVLTGFASNIKVIGDKGSRIFGVSVGVKQQDGSYKNVFVSSITSISTELKEKTKYVFKGFVSGSFWKDKDGKDKSEPTFRVMEIVEAKDKENENSLELTGSVINVKKFGKNGQGFGLSVGVKQKDGSFKNVFLDTVVHGDKEVKEKTRYDFKGFLSGHFWDVTVDGATKEDSRIQFVVTEFKDEEKKSK